MPKLAPVNGNGEDGFFSYILSDEKYEKVCKGKMRALSFRNKITPKSLIFLHTNRPTLSAEVLDVSVENGLTTVSFQLRGHTLVDLVLSTSDGFSPGPSILPKTIKSGEIVSLEESASPIKELQLGNYHGASLRPLYVVLDKDIGSI